MIVTTCRREKSKGIKKANQVLYLVLISKMIDLSVKINKSNIINNP